MSNFYGIDGVVFNWHGTNSDPSITYKGHEFNYWDVEETLWNYYTEDNPGKLECDLLEGFVNWMKNNPQETYNLLDDWIIAMEG